MIRPQRKHVSRSPSNLAGFIVVMVLVPGTWTAHRQLLAAEAESPAASRPAAESSPASAPPTTRQALGADASRILTNFANMMKGNWKSLALFAGTTVLNAVLWAIGMLLAGILAGLASYFIASAFNTLSVQVAEAATWFAAAPVLLFGHGLNIGLATIAIFAHGVRLNMLEFSANHMGMQWAGKEYDPFRE